MDPITHLLTGACISRAGLNRTSAWTTITMVLASDVPDIDVVAYAGGSVTGFAHHRGFTHTLSGVPFDSAIVVGLLFLVHQWRRRRGQEGAKFRSAPGGEPRWKLLYLYGCLAVLVHILMDFTNNYGVRPFAPFYSKWYSWDIVFIIEPLILAALLLALALPALLRLIQQEIGERGEAQPRGRTAAIVALAFVVFLWMFRDLQHRRALAQMRTLLYQGAEPLRVSAYPYWVNPFAWHGVVETKNFFSMVTVNSLTGEVDAHEDARIRYKPEETAVTLAAKNSRLGHVYLDWARYPMIEVEPGESRATAYTVRMFDLRFSYPRREATTLGCAVELNQDLKVVAEYFGSPRGGR